MLEKTLDRRRFMTLSAGVAGLTLLPQITFAQSGGKQKVAIASTSGDGGQTYVELLKNEKFLEKYDVEPEFISVSDGSKVVTAIISGESDICRGSGFGQALAAINKGADLRVVGGACLLITQAMYTSREDIKTIKDLEGRTVGTGAPGALLHHMTVALLRKYGVDVDKVQFVNVGSSSNVFKAVVAGTVDAGPSTINVYDEQAKYGVHSIADFWTELPEYPYQAAFTSLPVIAEKRDLLVRSLAGFQDMYNFIQGEGSQDAYVKAAMAATGDTEPSKSISQWKFVQKYKPFSIVMKAESINYLQQLNIDAKIQEAMLPIDKIADFTLAQDALKLVG